MKLYNTLTRTVEEFKPQQGNAVTMYSCGPTVYDHAHIGNLASFIAADTLKRALLATGYSVKHTMNFTDIDDKTIRRSRELHGDLQPMQALKKATSYFESLFYKDLAALNVDRHFIEFVRATESIEDMQKLITELHKAGVAYVTDDGVYFSIEAYKKKGRTYGQLVEVTAESTGAARVDNDEYDKDSVHDFALWKVQKASEPAWPFELEGKDLTGRPGWHIECSAMSTAALGQPYDIHTGGVDLKFPHHENEIAQSTAASNETWLARFFVHNEHLLVDGRKMSKSLGNFYTLEDIVKKGYDPLAFRLLVLQSHYRSQMNFTWEALDAAQNRFKKLQAFADLRFQTHAFDYDRNEIPTPVRGLLFDQVWNEIQNAMEDNINTPESLASLNKAVEQSLTHGGIDKSLQIGFEEFLRKLDAIFGLDLLSSVDINADIHSLIKQREEAREAKDWAKSDELRDQLVQQGILLNDTPPGSIWSRA